MDSLVLNNTIELLMQGAPSQDPRCLGAVFQLLPAYSFGNPPPAGAKTDLRTHKIPIGIRGPDRATVIAAREVLVASVSRHEWVLTWRKGDGPDTCFDCFHATTTAVVWDSRYERQNVGQVEITFPAMPYARATAYELLSFATSPSDALADAPSPIVVDDYATVTATHWARGVVYV